MRDTSRYLKGRGGAPAGFTLIEILIVGALIALFAGLAIFAAQEMYDSSKRKAMFDETKTLGTAMAIAHQDIGFFPRFNLLGTPLALATYQTGTILYIRPGFDIYGTLTATREVNRVMNNWKAPYSSVNEARRGFSQGTKLLVKMRLAESDVFGFSTTTPMGDISLVDWPADVWGNPYVLYVVTVDTSFQSPTANPQGLRLIGQAGETATWCAVVSYGPNGVPGGTNEKEQGTVAATAAYQNFKQTVLGPAMLYVPGDAMNGNNGYAPGGIPIYTLKSYRANGALSLANASFLAALPRSIKSNSTDPNEIGIRDSLSDDIYWEF